MITAHTETQNVPATYSLVIIVKRMLLHFHAFVLKSASPEHVMHVLSIIFQYFNQTSNGGCTSDS